MDYARPERLEEALRLAATGRWCILAGGTDIFPGAGSRGIAAATLDITAIEELRRLDRAEGFWSIGATVRWSDIVAAELPPALDGLKAAARQVGALQVQNQATVAGNVCNASPAADGVPPLLTLEAVVEIASSAEVRRLPLAEFLRGNRRTALRPGEIVTRILIPESAARGRSSFLKLGARRQLVISIAMVAARLVVGETGRVAAAAIAVGACSVVARRLGELEADLIGASADADLARRVEHRHLACLSPIDDVRASAAYRREAALELTRRALSACAEGER